MADDAEHDLIGDEGAGSFPAADRRAELQLLVDKPRRRRSDVEATAGRLGLHVSTVYRMLRRVSADRTADFGIVRPRGWRAGRSRLPAATELVINAVIENFAAVGQIPPMSYLRREIGRRCEAADLATPAASSLHRRLRKLLRSPLAAPRREMLAVVMPISATNGSPIGQANALWQIDHFRADVLIGDVNTRTRIRRPWITLAIDVASRAIAGVYVSLERPSCVSAGLVLRHAILDKAQSLQERGVFAQWPAFGLPHAIHSENASDFRGVNFNHACMSFGIRTYCRSQGVPHYGVHIARLLGAARHEMHELFKPDCASARRSLHEIETRLWRFIASDYNARIHPTTGLAPLAAWRKEVEGQDAGLRTPGDGDELAFEFLPSASGVITQLGVLVHCITYDEPFLKTLFEIGTRRLVVRFDPRDLSRIYVRTSKGIRVIRYQNPGRPPISFWELRAIRRQLAACPGGNLDEQAIFDAQRENLLLETDETVDAGTSATAMPDVGELD